LSQSFEEEEDLEELDQPMEMTETDGLAFDDDSES
jgi:hypothetical protein